MRHIQAHSSLIGRATQATPPRFWPRQRPNGESKRIVQRSGWHTHCILSFRSCSSSCEMRESFASTSCRDRSASARPCSHCRLVACSEWRDLTSLDESDCRGAVDAGISELVGGMARFSFLRPFWMPFQLVLRAASWHPRGRGYHAWYYCITSPNLCIICFCVLS